MRRRTLFFIASTVITIAVVLIVITYNKPHRSVVEVEPEVRLSALELALAFAADEVHATRQYAGKIVEVYGDVDRIIQGDSTLILLLEQGSATVGVSCYLDPHYRDEGESLSPGAPVTVKGICNGMLLDVVIDRAILTAR